MSNASVTTLLSKTEHYDKDERFMALSDLCELLKRHAANDAASSGTRLDSSSQRKICTAVLLLLDDKSNDVQAVAVKTLGVLLTTVEEEQVLDIAQSLADKVLDPAKKDLRDVYAIGLRKLVETIPPSMGDAVSHRLVGRVLEASRTNSGSEDAANGESIVLPCLDILTEIVTRFGATAVSVTRQHEAILHTCLHLVVEETSSPIVRKRAGTTLGCLSVVISDAMLASLIERLLSHLEGDTPSGDSRSLIRTMCTISGAVGHRLGQAQIDRIVPIFLQFTKPEEAVTGDDDEMSDDEDTGDDAMDAESANDDEDAIALANELRESCFAGFESFVIKCPAQIEAHLEKIIQVSLAYMIYDPNYSYGADEDEDNDEEMDDEYEEEDEYEDEEEEDDDDESWKVRRAAIRALKAVVETKKHNPAALWTKSYQVRKGKSSIFASALVARFKEREENCRVDIIDCFSRLLGATVTAASTGVLSIAKESSEMETEAAGSAIIDLRSGYVPSVIKACEKLLGVKRGGERSKSSVLSLLSVLCKAPGGVGGKEEIISVFKHIQTFLSVDESDVALHREASSKTLRLDALTLVYSILTCDNHDPVDIRQALSQSLLPQLCEAVKEQWYKVIAQALRAIAAIPRFFVIGYSAGTDDSARSTETSDVVKQLFEAIEPPLAAHDVDQEIKECALSACAALLSELHSNLSADQTNRMLSLLLERLKNDTTRIIAIKTLSSIASSSGDSSSMQDDASKLDLSPILSDAIVAMGGFLKLQSRSLKQNSLEALDVVVSNHGVPAGHDDLFATVVQDLSMLVVDADLHIAHLSLNATNSIIEASPSCGPAVKEHVLPMALELSTSPLLQDLSLQSLMTLLDKMIKTNAVDFTSLLEMLRGRMNAESSKGAIGNLAKCIAISTAAASADQRQSVLSDTISMLEGSAAADDGLEHKKIQLALHMSGELGQMIDLSQIDGVAGKLEKIYMGFFDSPSEDLKVPAATSLGLCAIGAPSVFLPVIMGSLESETGLKKQYLLLCALRRFIQSSKKESILGNISTILPRLEVHCSDPEEGSRTLAAECLGRLTCMEPSTFLPKLDEIIKAHSQIKTVDGVVPADDATSKKNALACWTIATAVKLSIAGKTDQGELSKYMPSFLGLLKQEELSVRNAALLMVYSAVHHMPQLVAGLMEGSILPTLYEAAQLKLQRKVDLGPFTHTVDDALPLRKTSLSIFSTCVENLPASLDIAAFMPILAKALGDVEDIQLQAHQIVLSMCTRQPTYLVAAVESFVDPLQKTTNKKMANKQGTELDRLTEWIKSTLRATLALGKLDGAMSNAKFATFHQAVNSNAKFRPMLDAIEADRS